MLLVNYFANYSVAPKFIKHSHDYCSYADLIMPQFLFAVGFAMRLTFGRRMARDGNVAAYGRMAKRLLGLVLVSLIIYTVSPRAESWEKLVEIGFWGAIQEPLKRQWFQTLMHIAVTSLWILPVIHAKPAVRVAWMLGSVLLHIALSNQFNFLWVNTSPNGIDGGPLGFLTWTVPAIIGSMACDWFVANRATSQIPLPENESSITTPGTVTTQGTVLTPAVRKSLTFGAILMLAAYGLSCGTRLFDVESRPELSPDDGAEGSVSNVETVGPKLAAHPVLPPLAQWKHKLEQGSITTFLAEPPLVPPPGIESRKWNYWMMSQRGGTASYTLFAAGFALCLFALFYIACDRLGWQLSVFTTFGTNALVAYILHGMVSSAVQPFFPKDSPAWYALTGLALFFLINWLFLRSLQKQNIYLRV